MSMFHCICCCFAVLLSSLFVIHRRCLQLIVDLLILINNTYVVNVSRLCYQSPYFLIQTHFSNRCVLQFLWDRYKMSFHSVLAMYGVNLCSDSVAAGRGARGHAPRAALCRGRHLEGWKDGILKLAASGELTFALQTVIFYTPNIPPVLGPHPLTVSAPRLHTKQWYTKILTLLICLNIHLL